MTCRHELRRSVMRLMGCAFLVASMYLAASAENIGREITVPLDYANPGLGSAKLYFEFGAPFEKAKPTVFVIADGQQFFVRRGSITDLQRSLFGSAFNVVGIVSRGATPEFVKSTVDAAGNVNWQKAWNVFNSNQWIQDIDQVRKTVVGPNGKIYLYGRSGGAYLVHQYLATFGQSVARVFTQSPVNPLINRELGIEIEKFWQELGVQDAKLQPMLHKVLARRADDKIRILVTLQRQHFFIAADKLPAARADLIQALDRGDEQFYERARKEYQTDEIMKLNASTDSVPQMVRVLELIYPSGAFQRMQTDAVYPLLETQRHFLKPLLDLLDAGKISIPSYTFAPAHRLSTEVFILAARWDEAVDYRTSIALAYSYPRHVLFIADDNHVFTRLNEAGLTTRLLQNFLSFGMKSPEFRNALAEAERQRWAER